MTNLKTFPTEVTAGANGQQHSTGSAAMGLADMAQATALKVMLGADQDDIRDGMAGVLVFLGTLCHTMEVDMEDLLNHAAKLVAEIEERDAAEKAAGGESSEAATDEDDLDQVIAALAAIIAEGEAEDETDTADTSDALEEEEEEVLA